MEIKIIVDSGCDITQKEAEEKGIVVLPLKTTFGETEYLDGVTITTEEFYRRLVEYDDFPKTSQIAPFEYEKAFSEALEIHDYVICITVSSKLSGCYQSANIAASEFEGRVAVVDSENVSIGFRNLVDYALTLLSKENDFETIVDTLNTQKKKMCIIALLDTLEYLKKGGRISAAAAMAGSVLSIKPVVTVVDGEIAVLGKARGSKNGRNLLSECVKIKGPIDYSKPYCLAYSGLSDELLKLYLEDNSHLYRIDKSTIGIHLIGSTIGTHVGPGAIAAAFFVE